MMTVAFFISLTFLSTYVGGLFGLRHRDHLHLILGFTAGVLLAVVAFDVLPEIFGLLKKMAGDATPTMVALVCGFLLFHISEKLLLIHQAREEGYLKHQHPGVGVLSALALTGHSFLDGVGVGLGFQVSASTGLLVALAVIAHDFSDGLNTVSLMITHQNSPRRALLFLFFDALAPLLGGLATLFFSLPESFLLPYLGFFAGFLLYIGAAEILPEAHHEHSSVKTILMTLLGVVSIFAVTRILK